MFGRMAGMMGTEKDVNETWRNGRQLRYDGFSIELPPYLRHNIVFPSRPHCGRSMLRTHESKVTDGGYAGHHHHQSPSSSFSSNKQPPFDVNLKYILQSAQYTSSLCTSRIDRSSQSLILPPKRTATRIRCFHRISLFSLCY
jgi:hypothetical protein